MKHILAFDLNVLVYLICFLCLFMGCSRPIDDPVIGFGGYIKNAVTDQVIDSGWIDADSLPPYFVYSETTGYYYYGYFGYPPEDFHIFVGKQDYLVKDTIIHVPWNMRFLDSVVIKLEPVDLIK